MRKNTEAAETRYPSPPQPTPETTAEAKLQYVPGPVGALLDMAEVVGLALKVSELKELV